VTPWRDIVSSVWGRKLARIYIRGYGGRGFGVSAFQALGSWGTVSWGCARGASPQAVIFWAFSPVRRTEDGGRRTEGGGGGNSVFQSFGVSVWHNPGWGWWFIDVLPKVAPAATLGWRAKSRWDF
jgi:hypothetical protein